MIKLNLDGLNLVLTVFILIVLHGPLINSVEILEALHYKAPKRWNIIKVSDPGMVHLVKVFSLIEKLTTEGSLLRPRNVTLTL